MVRAERRLGAAADRLRGVARRVELVRDDDLARIERFVERQRHVDERQLSGRVLDRVVDAARHRRLRDDRAAARVERREHDHLGSDDDVGAQQDPVRETGRREHAPVVPDVVACREHGRTARVAGELDLRSVDELVESAERVRVAARARAELAPLRAGATAVEAREEVVARERVVAAQARVAGDRVRTVVRVAVVRARRAAELRRTLERVRGVVRERRERTADGARTEQRDAAAARARAVRLAVRRIGNSGNGTRAHRDQSRHERLAQVRREERVPLGRRIAALRAQDERTRRQSG